jgi:hypothetical protein
MENPQPDSNLNTIIQWLTAHKAQVITMLVVFTLGLIALNYMIEIYAKADLLMNSCELCEKLGNKCYERINWINFTSK